jgi:hypothetical protein
MVIFHHPSCFFSLPHCKDKITIKIGGDFHHPGCILFFIHYKDKFTIKKVVIFTILVVYYFLSTMRTNLPLKGW